MLVAGCQTFTSFSALQYTCRAVLKSSCGRSHSACAATTPLNRLAPDRLYLAMTVRSDGKNAAGILAEVTR